MKIRWLLLPFLCSVLHVTSSQDEKFDVLVPSEPQVATQGGYTVLNCSFTVGATQHLGNVVVTWQRGQEVVHSFYYGRDQLDRQSHRYGNRTSLYHSELELGNVSLRLASPSPDDAGDYTCFVSTLIGSHNGILRLQFAAFYTEPQVHMAASLTGVQLMLSSQGYPAPQVQWLDERMEDIGDAVTELQIVTQGFYSVSSRLTFPTRAGGTFTFLLINQALGQELRRVIVLHADLEQDQAQMSHRLLVLMVPTCFFLLIMLAVYCLLQQSKAHSPDKLTNNNSMYNSQPV